MKRVYAYYRVSSSSQKENIESQKLELRKYIESRADWVLTDEFEDVAVSGDNFQRKGYLAMMDKALNGGCDIIAVISLSRLGRSLPIIVNQVYELKEKSNVSVYAHSESLLTDDSISGSIVLATLSALNEANLRIIRSAVRNGVQRKMDEYKREGKAWGCPVKGVPLDRLVDLRENKKLSIRQCATALNVSPATIVRRLRQIEAFQKGSSELPA
jgi:DNA invertase Pin-like site-specific DNA recombinase